MGFQTPANFSRLKSTLFSLNSTEVLTLSMVSSVHCILFLQIMSSKGTDLILKFSFQIMYLRYIELDRPECK